jgi:hypothetical protein
LSFLEKELGPRHRLLNGQVHIIMGIMMRYRS